jgi:uncharacterized protein YqfA (UPF0365 family)
MDFAPALVVVAVVLAMLVWLIVVVVILMTGRTWLQAYLSGVPLSIFTLLGMRLRRTNVNAVVRAMIMAKQGGLNLSWREIESAQLTGVDLEKVVLAMIESVRRQLGFTFQQLVEAEQHDRLQEKLNS